MADLLKNTAKSADTSRHALEIERKQAAHRAFNAHFAALALNKAAPVPDRPTHLLSGNLPSFPPVPQTAQKADPLADASESIKRLALRHGPEAGKLLDLIERRSKAEGGRPINFDTTDAASVMGVPPERAERILHALLQAGTLTPRTGVSGVREGYSITAT